VYQHRDEEALVKDKLSLLIIAARGDLYRRKAQVHAAAQSDRCR
jgi:hypothetical protein